jgi:riboflavin synthase
VIFEVVRETLDRSSLGDLRSGSRVNLERALRADGRLDGHIVQGHVDGTGRVRAIERQGDDVRFAVDCEPEFAALLVPKGSIAIDGVSLTLVQVGVAGFDVALIPHTLAATNLADRQPGDRVNLEADVLGKYVQKYLERIHGAVGESTR